MYTQTSPNINDKLKKKEGINQDYPQKKNREMIFVMAWIEEASNQKRIDIFLDLSFFAKRKDAPGQLWICLPAIITSYHDLDVLTMKEHIWIKID